MFFFCGCFCCKMSCVVWWNLCVCFCCRITPSYVEWCLGNNFSLCTICGLIHFGLLFWYSGGFVGCRFVGFNNLFGFPLNGFWGSFCLWQEKGTEKLKKCYWNKRNFEWIEWYSWLFLPVHPLLIKNRNHTHWIKTSVFNRFHETWTDLMIM